MTWPLEPEGALRFARGLQKVIVVEEKRALIERSAQGGSATASADMPQIVWQARRARRGTVPEQRRARP